jgi:sulfate adenylyltransferase
VTRFAPELGIEVVPAAAVFYCAICGGIVSERTCPHSITQPR